MSIFELSKPVCNLGCFTNHWFSLWIFLDESLYYCSIVLHLEKTKFI